MPIYYNNRYNSKNIVFWSPYLKILITKWANQTKQNQSKQQINKLLFPLIYRVSRQPTHLPEQIDQMQIECALFLGRFADSKVGKLK